MLNMFAGQSVSLTVPKNPVRQGLLTTTTSTPVRNNSNATAPCWRQGGLTLASSNFSKASDFDFQLFNCIRIRKRCQFRPGEQNISIKIHCFPFSVKSPKDDSEAVIEDSDESCPGSPIYWVA